jgi:hypothetical protein
MPHHPVNFEFAVTPPPAGVEAVARRRMRGIESRNPGLCEWYARIEARQPPRDGRHFAAVVGARLADGATLTASAEGCDAFAALRLAFNELERELEADQADARIRAAAWLKRVKERIGGVHAARGIAP